MFLYEEIIALAWMSNLFVSFYVNLCIKKRVTIRKPFGCEKCMGFWIGFFYLLTLSFSIKQSIIFACFTSLAAILLNGISKYVNGTRV